MKARFTWFGIALRPFSKQIADDEEAFWGRKRVDFEESSRPSRRKTQL